MIEALSGNVASFSNVPTLSTRNDEGLRAFVRAFQGLEWVRVVRIVKGWSGLES